MPRDEATPRCGNNCGANKRPGRDASIIARDYGKGTLIGGLLIAVTFGSMLVHAAVM